MSKEETKEIDVLNDIKKVDKAVRAKTLATVLGELKRNAHDIAMLKEETGLILAAIGVADEDHKRVIDYINSQEDVKLTKSELRELESTVHERVAEVKRQAVKK